MGFVSFLNDTYTCALSNILSKIILQIRDSNSIIPSLTDVACHFNSGFDDELWEQIVYWNDLIPLRLSMCSVGISFSEPFIFWDVSLNPPIYWAVFKTRKLEISIILSRRRANFASRTSQLEILTLLLIRCMWQF